MLSNFGLRRRDEITIIPNGHEHVKRCCPDRSPFAAMEENRHPFVFLLGSRAVHKNVEMLFSIAGELDPLGSSRRLHTASLPEVCGDAALFADPKSPRGWLAQIKRLLAELDLARGLHAKGARQTGRCSWKTSGQAYLDLITSLFPGAAPEQKGEVDPSMQSAKAIHDGAAI